MKKKLDRSESWRGEEGGPTRRCTTHHCGFFPPFPLAVCKHELTLPGPGVRERLQLYSRTLTSCRGPPVSSCKGNPEKWQQINLFAFEFFLSHHQINSTHYLMLFSITLTNCRDCYWMQLIVFAKLSKYVLFRSRLCMNKCDDKLYSSILSDSCFLRTSFETQNLWTSWQLR